MKQVIFNAGDVVWEPGSGLVKLAENDWPVYTVRGLRASYTQDGRQFTEDKFRKLMTAAEALQLSFCSQNEVDALLPPKRHVIYTSWFINGTRKSTGKYSSDEDFKEHNKSCQFVSWAEDEPQRSEDSTEARLARIEAALAVLEGKGTK